MDAELAPEDELRLNVLLAQRPEALRIDESRLIVHALTAAGEASVALNPNCAEATYLRRVKALLSSQVLGSPGGYPVFLERWTRMGQTRDDRLERLLLLGESEAVVAVAHAPGLTETLARRAWWAMPDAVNARQMLAHPAIAGSDIGRELAAFLLEFLPFESEAGAMLDSVRLVLQPGLIDDGEVERLWQRAQSRRSLLVGFLQARPDGLPLELPEHPARRAQAGWLAAAAPPAAVLDRVFAAPGQAFVDTCERALERVGDQDVTVALFAAIAAYFTGARALDAAYRDVERLQADVDALPWNGPAALEPAARAAWFLAALSVELLNPIFARTDAIGSGMRRKIEPLTARIFQHLAHLRG